MKVAVFGASGGTGRLLCEGALEHGHEVTAFVRDPDKLGIEHERLRVVRGDVTDASAVDGAVAGQEAVASVLGPAGQNTGDPSSAEGTRNIVASMEKHGVPRFICTSIWGVADSEQYAPFFFRKVLLPLLFKKTFAVKEQIEETVRASDLDWVLPRPMRLVDGDPKGYATALDGKGCGSKITRADLAAFILDALEQGGHSKTAPCVGGA